MKLARQYVEKPWGRTALPSLFDAPQGKRIGEVWFTGDRDLPLLAKYIFTSEALSIQVHPSDKQAKERGLPSGKAECWYILDAEPDAKLGIGLDREVTDQHLENAALDGSIEELLAWHPVRAGDFVFVAPGTIHAIGAGVSLLEFQQNADITYRLYDYGRPRELHLDDGVAVVIKRPFDRSQLRHIEEGTSATLVDGPPFRLAASSEDRFADELRWIMPICGQVQVNDEPGGAGDIFLASPGDRAEFHDAWALIGTTA